MTFCLHLDYITQVKKEFNVIEDPLLQVDINLFLAMESLRIWSLEWVFLAECCPQLKSFEVSPF